jgi:hypothetical protein
MKSKRDEVATINIVQVQFKELYFIFNLEYRLPLYQEGYHMNCQQSLNAQYNLKISSEMSETQWPHTLHISLNQKK